MLKRSTETEWGEACDLRHLKARNLADGVSNNFPSHGDARTRRTSFVETVIGAQVPLGAIE